jgi:hypothetical protein
MKRSSWGARDSKSQKMSLRSETLRVLTQQELAVVIAGNCVNGSQISQETTAALLGIC